MREASLKRELSCESSREVIQEVKFEDFQDELMQFLAFRFSSIALAERISQEMKIRITEMDILALVGNPKVYLSSYGLSLGLQFLQEELGARVHFGEIE
jgi:hypothetical protein